MASDAFWIALFIVVAIVICLLFARVVIRSIKGGNCHCGGNSCSGCQGNCSSCNYQNKDKR